MVDIRSRAKGTNTLGPDSNSNGIVRSLQVVVGKGKVEGQAQVTLGYADLDCENPAENAKSWAIHTGKVIGSGVKAGVRYIGSGVKKAGKWVWKYILRQN